MAPSRENQQAHRSRTQSSRSSPSIRVRYRQPLAFADGDVTSATDASVHRAMPAASHGRGVRLIGEALAHPMADFYLVLSASGLLVALGVLMVLSSSSAYAAYHDLSVYYFVLRQLIFLVAGLPLMGWLSRRSEQFLAFSGWLLLIVAVVAQLVVLFTPLGSDRGKGNRNWLDLGVVTIQPSEFAKVGLVVWAAAVLSTRGRAIDRPARLLVPLLPAFVVVLGLVLFGGDLGTAMIITAVLFAVLWFAGTPVWLLASLGLTAVAGVSLAVVTSPMRVQRLMAYLNPASAVSDQPQNALYALASGGWWGVGLGASRQKWGGLADAALNDYVFAVLGEELGLLGTLAVILLFTALGYAGLRIALRSTSTFFRIAAAGITGWLIMQAVLNMAMAMKLTPVVGVPLPFISYGGSALMADLIGIGVLLAAARHEPVAAALSGRSRITGPRLTSIVDVPSGPDAMTLRRSHAHL